MIYFHYVKSNFLNKNFRFKLKWKHHISNRHHHHHHQRAAASVHSFRCAESCHCRLCSWNSQLTCSFTMWDYAKEWKCLEIHLSIRKFNIHVWCLWDCRVRWTSMNQKTVQIESQLARSLIFINWTGFTEMIKFKEWKNNIETWPLKLFFETFVTTARWFCSFCAESQKRHKQKKCFHSNANWKLQSRKCWFWWSVDAVADNLIVVFTPNAIHELQNLSSHQCWGESEKITKF